MLSFLTICDDGAALALYIDVSRLKLDDRNPDQPRQKHEPDLQEESETS